MGNSLITCTLLVLLFSQCNPTPERNETIYTGDQHKIDSLRDRYASIKFQAPNLRREQEWKKSFLDSINRYLADTMKFHLSNIRVKVEDISTTHIGNLIAFSATFHDSNKEYGMWNAEYWMEFDYPEDNKSALQNNPAYILLSNVRAHSDTTLSFFYMGEVEAHLIYHDRLKIKVVPFLKGFNFDSVVIANKKKH